MKIYECEVSAGVATITDENGEPVVIPDAVFNSQGVKESKGQLIVSGEMAIYVVNTQPDLVEIVGKIGDVLDQIKAIADTPVSRTPDSSPLAPDASAAVTQIKTELEAFTYL